MLEGMSLAEIIKLLMPLIILQLILMVTALVVLFKAERVRFLPKWAWVLIIVIGEVLGPIVFLTIGREKDV